LKTAGSQTLTATDTVSSSITGTSATVAVATGGATHFTLSAPASAAANTAFSFTVTALDASNNTVTGYVGIVHFTSSDGTAVLPADTTLSNGVGSFSATLKTAGSQTLTASDTVTASITGTSGTITVSGGAATHFSVSAPATATAGTAFNITVTALDPFNNTVTGYSGTVHFTSSDGAAVIPANSTLTNGVGTFSATLKTSGSRTITATDTVTSSITATSGAITVSAAAATHFTVSTGASASANVSFAVTVTALDLFNNTATTYSGTVHFTSTDPIALLPANGTLASGVGTFTATLKTSGTETITATDTVTASITGTSGSIAVNSGSITYSAPSATGTGTITATITGGGGTCALGTGQYIAAPPGTTPVPPTTPGPNIAFPQGMFNMALTGCTVGSTITVTMTYPQAIDGATYWKYGATAANPAAHWYSIPATINGNTAVFSITDGGIGDDDFTANGSISDPGGPGVGSGVAIPIPTLSWWMLALLALMLGAFAWRERRA
jgi:hypothetical protein